MFSTILLPPRAQLCIRYCSNKQQPGGKFPHSGPPSRAASILLTASQGLPDAHVTGKNLTPKSKGPGVRRVRKKESLYKGVQLTA